MFQTADMFKAFAPYRGNAVVIPGRGGRHWINLSDKPDRDVPLGDPAMGGHASFALGLALARPDEKIILFDSEGDILMNMGALPTIAEKDPKNFYHFVLDNGVYATTGGQPVPNAENIQYDVIAKGSNIDSGFSGRNRGIHRRSIPPPVAWCFPPVRRQPLFGRRRRRSPPGNT